MSDTELKIQNDMVVKLVYQLTVDGETLGNCNPDPIVYLHGYEQIIPGFEKAVAGMKMGENKQFTVSPDDGYGYREEDAVIVMPKEEYPDDLPLELGMELEMINEDGEEIPAWLTDISQENITVDFNHPLADKTLHFDVQILDIRPATAEEIEHQTVQETDQ